MSKNKSIAEINESLENNEDLNQTAVVVETPKAAKPKEPVIRKTPVADRIYRAVLNPIGEVVQRSFKGKQRQATYDALVTFSAGATSKQVAEIAGDKVIAKKGAEASVAWHLHHLALMGIAEIVNPTITIE